MVWCDVAWGCVVVLWCGVMFVVSWRVQLVARIFLFVFQCVGMLFVFVALLKSHAPICPLKVDKVLQYR